MRISVVSTFPSMFRSPGLGVGVGIGVFVGEGEGVGTEVGAVKRGRLKVKRPML